MEEHTGDYLEHTTVATVLVATVLVATVLDGCVLHGGRGAAWGAVDRLWGTINPHD